MNQQTRTLTLACALALPMLAAQTAAACGTEPYIGEVCTFGFTYCPNGFLPANGSLLPINQYQALFSLLGNYYGGDGRSNFALPDLRGRTVVGTGQGAGLSNVTIGQTRGAEQVTLNVNQMPAHTHAATLTAPSVSVNAKLAAATTGTPAATLQLGDAGRNSLYVATSASGNDVAIGGVSVTGGSVAIAPAGGSAPVTTLPPELGMTVCIATQGIYPSRP